VAGGPKDRERRVRTATRRANATTITTTSATTTYGEDGTRVARITGSELGDESE
jgi:hypothetical protein